MKRLFRHPPQQGITVALVLLALVLVLIHVTEWPSPEHVLGLADVIIILAAIVAMLAPAIALAGLRRTAWLHLGDIQAQSVFRLVSRQLAPPAVAAGLTASHTGRWADALAVFGAMLLATVALGGTRYPLHLSGVARFVFDLCMPALGISLALIAAALWQVPLGPEAMVVPLLGGWLVTFAGGWLEEAFNARRPVRLAVIGEPALARAFAVEMRAEGVHDHRMVGWISEASQEDSGRPAESASSDSLSLEWLGSADHVRSAVLEHEIDLLVMTPRGASPDLFLETVEQCVDLPVRMIQAAHLYEEMHGRVPIGAINSAWFAYIMHPNFSSRASWGKRAMDLGVSSVMLLLLAPLFAIVAVAVKQGDRGPIFFRQRRVGALGRDFDVLKFRTMRQDAEQPGKPQWASANDARVTRVGKVLRKSHLDEMPQLINVLRGDMSLVGPRPERPEFVTELEKKVPYYSRRVLLRPGITGWAQVRSGYSGSDAGTAFKVSHDLYYIKHRSLLFDLLTMVETVRTLVADVQFGQFTYSEAFILGSADLSEEPAAVGRLPVLGDMAALAENLEDVARRGDQGPGWGDSRPVRA